jgi:hypothetical protein
MALTSINAPVYRYFTVDLLSNALLAEIPFKGVSYERALKGAGAFSGTVPVISTTNSMDLYESTMPGKTALYIVRDNVCVLRVQELRDAHLQHHVHDVDLRGAEREPL